MPWPMKTARYIYQAIKKAAHLSGLTAQRRALGPFFVSSSKALSRLGAPPGSASRVTGGQWQTLSCYIYTFCGAFASSSTNFHQSRRPSVM